MTSELDQETFGQEEVLQHYNKEMEKADEKYDLQRLMSKRLQNPLASSTVTLDERTSYSIKTVPEDPHPVKVEE